MGRRSSRSQRGVRTRNIVAFSSLRIHPANTSAFSSLREKEMTSGQTRAASSTRSAWSQSRFTTAVLQREKSVSFEEK